MPLPAGVWARTRRTDGPVVLADPPYQPPPRNLGLAALVWSPANGHVSLPSVDLSTPLLGSKYVGSGYTEVRSLAGAFGRAPFALMGYFGGGLGYALSVAGDDLLPDPAYQAGRGEPPLLEEATFPTASQPSSPSWDTGASSSAPRCRRPPRGTAPSRPGKA